MSAYTTLLYTITGNILTITLNLPESYNALNEAMMKELNDALQQAEKDESAW